MKINSLELKRAASYEENPNMLKGLVSLAGPTGSQIVTLTNTTILRILEVIREQVQDQAKANATQVASAFDDARSESLLIAADCEPLQIEA